LTIEQKYAPKKVMKKLVKFDAL